MSTKIPEPISCSNLSHAWGQTFLRLMKRGSGSLGPMIVSIDDFTSEGPVEDPDIRNALDHHLAANGKYGCADTALTIFPFKHWMRTRCSCKELAQWYLKEYYPRLKSRDRLNCKGTYFQRMVGFTGVKKSKDTTELVEVNQLDHIIGLWQRDKARNRRPRQSALQVACFDPAKDHTGQPLQGFPCLQQVSLAYDDGGQLAVTALYPTQYIFDRAYGNYLGLSHLGLFMADQMGLRLSRLTCYIGHPQLGRIQKESLLGLATNIRDLLANGETTSGLAQGTGDKQADGQI
jgi:hypothetical protein